MKILINSFNYFSLNSKKEIFRKVPWVTGFKNKNNFFYSIKFFSSVIPASGYLYPYQVLKLGEHYWRWQSPRDANNGKQAGAAENIDLPKLKTYDNAPWVVVSQKFVAKDQSKLVQFRADCGGATTKGTQYARSELREMSYCDKDKKIKEAKWDTQKGIHILELSSAITHAPKNAAQICIAQVHFTSHYGLILHYDGNDKKTPFKYLWKDNYFPLSGLQDYKLGHMIDWKIEVKGVTIEKENNQKEIDGECILSCSIDSQEKERVTINNFNSTKAYFKAGAYLQANTCTDSVDDYGEVLMKSISVKHLPKTSTLSQDKTDNILKNDNTVNRFASDKSTMSDMIIKNNKMYQQTVSSNQKNLEENSEQNIQQIQQKT